ncbi:MAG: ATPase [Sphingomonadales bacterium]|nr:ATPase [Sphingomonadales bacterium]
MNRGSRIVAFGPGGEQPSQAGESSAAAAEQPLVMKDEWLADPEDTPDDEAPPPARHEWAVSVLAPVVALVAIVGWTGFFLWAMRGRLAGSVSADEAVALLGNWATPVLLVCVIWLIGMRTSRREARRFGDIAQLLSTESANLEGRLTAVNRELSLAREFIAAQARDLESLGRVAGDRMSEHADRLQELIRDNGAQVDAIASVSTTALENMERLRGQLPVIASSAKDVANNIGHIGRTANGSVSELTAAFERLAASGEASEAKAGDLQTRIDSSLTLFDERLEHLQNVVAARIEELEHRGEELRGRLDSQESAALAALQSRAATLGDTFEANRRQLENQEVDALAALRSRAAALAEEFKANRQQLDSHETESLAALRSRAAALAEELETNRLELESQEVAALTALRTRLGTLHEEATTLAHALREGESNAMQALLATKNRIETDIRATVERLDRLDRDALDAARSRIASLSQEAGEFDDRLAERNAQFSEETEQRLAVAAARHDAEVARVAALFEQIDASLSDRHARQDKQQQDLARQSEAIAARMDGLSEQIAAISAFGNQAEQSLGTGLALLTQRLAESRDALAGTDVAVGQLTDGATSLLDLLKASTEQSRDELPAALAGSEERLAEWELRVAELRDTVESAAARGDTLADSVTATRTSLGQSLGELGELQSALGDGARQHSETLDGLRETLAALDRDSLAIAAQAQAQLTAAIEQLAEATRATVNNLGDDTHGAVTRLANRLGEDSAAAIDRIMRVRMAEAVGQLEQAAGHAAGVSREAAIQLRDQLAKVDELAGNLERRVAHARTRAEEQVDNDFARRVALITESLNSNAIDVAKALSTEVTDISWAAYLRGDRGVFTRRAVKLIDTAEAREITRIYEDDMEFRDHVSRYIHDFEAMLRQLLSTRDGHALGVTLLSSDIGKLYVVLAQAIERLRS